MNNQVAQVSKKALAAVEPMVPAGYKQTEVGVIPEDWDEVLLGSLIIALEAGVSVNSVDKPEAFSHGKHILKTSCVDSGYFDASEVKSIIPKDVNRAKCSPVKGAIIISRMNTPTLVGEVGYVPEDCQHTFLPDRLWQMRFKNDAELNSRWLAYLLSFPNVAQKIKESATGTSGSMKNISKESFLSLKIPSLPLQEQTAIANALSDMDALIGSLEALIAKKQAIKTATMQQLLTGRTRLPQFATHPDGSPKGYKTSELGEIPEDWEVEQLEKISDSIRNGANYKTVYKDGVAVTRIETIANGFIDFERTGMASVDSFSGLHEILGGDILYSHINSIDHIGKVAIYSGSKPLYHGINLLLIRPSKSINPFWLFKVLSSEVARKWAKQVAKQAVSQASINTKELKEFLLVKPCVQEQTAIATILSDMDEEIQVLEQRLAKTRDLKQGMMQQLLTGKTRLI